MYIHARETTKLIRDAKRCFYEKLGDKLSDTETGQKDFCTVFKRISNKKKLTNIPPIFENNCYIPNFQHKANICNAYFADQSNIYDNGSALPVPFSRANASLSHVNITHNRIVDIIQKCSAKKALGCDEITVAMLHLCASELAYPLRLMLQKCMTSDKFPDSWKDANVVPIHKKGNRQLKMNYRPISLLPICDKILEKIVFDQVYSFLNVNNLLSNYQSGFRPGDSAIYQLISITSVRPLTKCDTMDKLKCNGISGSLLDIFQNYLQNRYQRAVLNGTLSDWRSINAGVPQGSVLGPLLILVYINDLTDNISSEMRLFADDSSLFTRVEEVNETHEKPIKDLQTVTDWAYQWKMVFNPDITKQAIEIIFSVKKKILLTLNCSLMVYLFLARSTQII